jgi:hypothetical protein
VELKPLTQKKKSKTNAPGFAITTRDIAKQIM